MLSAIYVNYPRFIYHQIKVEPRECLKKNSHVRDPRVLSFLYPLLCKLAQKTSHFSCTPTSAQILVVSVEKKTRCKKKERRFNKIHRRDLV